MDLKPPVLDLVRQHGAHTQTAVRTVLRMVLPGCPTVHALMDGILNATRDNGSPVGDGDWALDSAKFPAMTPGDIPHLDRIVQALGKELAPMMVQAEDWREEPERAEAFLNVHLASGGDLLSALHPIERAASACPSTVRDRQRLLQQKGYSPAASQALHPLFARVTGIAAMVEEMREAVMWTSDVTSSLRSYRQAITALAEGDLTTAGPLLAQMVERNPESTVALTALAAWHILGRDLDGAKDALTRARTLAPEDHGLADLLERVHQTTGGSTSGIHSLPLPRKGDNPVVVGDLLDGWLIEQQLGKGGMGEVFRATRGDQVCAIKVLLPKLSSDPDFVRGFRREIQALIQLPEHPNLVRIYDFGYSRDVWYYVMDYIEGVPLNQYLKRNGSLSVPEARHVFRLLAAGLSAVHEAGLVHRDIKPANIIMQETGTPVLVDFGLAMETQHANADPGGKPLPFTLMFAPWEQLAGDPMGPSADVWALGGGLLHSVRYQSPRDPDPHKAKPELFPADLRDVLKRSLARRPDDRYPDAGAFRDALTATASPSELAETTIWERGKLAAWAATSAQDTPDVPGFTLVGVESFSCGNDAEGEHAFAVPVYRCEAFAEAAGVPAEERAPDVEFVLLPPPGHNGEFHMGSLPAEPHRQDDEHRRLARVPRFLIARTPVSQRVFGGLAPGHFPFDWDDPQLPAIEMTWEEAFRWCGQLGLKLPREVEWEFACRAGTQTPFCFGTTLTGTQGNYNTEYPYASPDPTPRRERPAAVGAYPPNAFGLLQCHGNVWEWVADDYAAVPKSPDAPGQPAVGCRVMRGGSFGTAAQACRSAFRGWGRETTRRSSLGFRPAKAMPRTRRRR